MTDSILRSYYSVTTSMFVPVPEPATGALLLLDGETNGFAFNATTADGGAVAVKDTGTPSNNLSNVILDASNIVNASTSAKMVHHLSSPYVRWSSHNLILQSQTFDNASWTKQTVSITADNTTAPDGTSTADLVNAAAHSDENQGYLLQQITSTSGFTYTGSVYAKAAAGGQWVRMSVYDGSHHFVWFDLTGGAVGTTGSGVTGSITSAGSGWYRCAVTRITTGADLFWIIQPTGADNSGVGTTADDIYVWGAQVNRGSIATPYLVTTSAVRIGIPQSYDVAGTRYGIWAEPQTTQLELYSEELDNAVWSASNITVSTNATTAPDALSTADKILTSGGNAVHVHTQIRDLGTLGPATYSFYAKSAEFQYAAVRLGGTGDGTRWITAIYDLTNGTVTDTDAGAQGTYITSTITSIGDGWYRCTLTGSISSSNLNFVGASPFNAATSAFAAFGEPAAFNDDSKGIYVWGEQAESGSIATSYIPSLSAAPVRAADISSALDTTFPGSDTNNTIYLDYKPLNVGSGTRYGWAYWKDANNFYSLAGVTANPTMGNTNAGSSEFAVDIGTLVAGTRTQITIAAKGNDFDGSQDGAAPTAQGTATLTTAYTTLYLGTFGTTGSELSGYIYRMVIVPYQRETVNGDLETWRYNF